MRKIRNKVKIINEGIRHLSDLNAKVLLCTVDPCNEASLNLQRSLGFEQIETEPFENFEVDGLIMFKLNIAQNFNIVPLADNFNHLGFICDLIKKNEDGQRQLYKEIREKLILNARTDELNYIVRKGVVPIGWLQVSDNLYEGPSVLVYEKYKSFGVEDFALNFIENSQS